MSGALLAGALLAGCEGTIGSCAGGDCPQLPGCEETSSVTCDENHLCQEQICEGVGWICGLDAQGQYAWQRSSVPCTDNDPCTENDTCAHGKCVGIAVVCKTPPARTCVDSQTLRSYDTTGTCKGGTCEYTYTDLKCPKDCQAGQCSGAPCLGVKCDNPPGVCYQKQGTCAGGTCTYTALAVGTSCDPGDKCTQNATCDAQKQCKGTAVDCSRTNTTGGTCVSSTGACQGYSCVAGYGNCNSSGTDTGWTDGCETALTTTSNCGSCGNACASVPNATPTCKSGACAVSCTSPYADCDKKYSNGCEIPVGVANKCNRSGLGSFSGSTPPCGTAHCGSHATDSKHQSFTTWYCQFCPHCYKFSNGGSWCLYASSQGNFSPDRCTTCCNPSDPSYPAVCK